MIYRFRAILDHENKEDIFRDIEIRKTDTFEDLHNVLTQSFGFDGSEMASFYVSNDYWHQGQEIALFDMGQNEDIRMMNETIIEDVLDEDNTKLIYIYDFLNMWTFLVELGEIVEEAQGTILQMFVTKQGETKHFNSIQGLRRKLNLNLKFLLMKKPLKLYKTN